MIAKLTGERRQGHGGQVDVANGDQKMSFLQFGRNYNVKFAIATRGMPIVGSPTKAMSRMQKSPAK